MFTTFDEKGKHVHHLYVVIFEFNSLRILKLGKMSVKLRLNGLSDVQKQTIEKKLTITCNNNEDINVFDVVKESTGKYILLPFSFAHSFFPCASTVNIKPTTTDPNCNIASSSTPPLKHISSASSSEFKGILRTEQQHVRDTAIKSLNETRSIVICAAPGFGKTITSIEMICRINTPTVIFVKQTMIMNQWIDSLKVYAPNKKVVKITTNRPVDDSADIYLVNPIILKKDINKNFEHIKLVVVDELHQIVSKVVHKAFFKFQPDYMIGLSATPYRPKMDPFEPAVVWFFGSKCVGNKLYRKHTVYCIKTNFTPETRIQPHTGKLDWSSVLTSQAGNEQRNKLIVKAVRMFPERTWLILVKRVEHAKTLQSLFATEGADSETIIGSTREFNKSCKILIGTTPKIGVGFDHQPIDALCMAADVLEYFEQFLGRCMRREDVEPIVIDFEDKFNPLVKHLNNRIQKYKFHGGKVNNMFLEKGDSEERVVDQKTKFTTKTTIKRVSK
jgi:superfamily II DNA or RNA helicase